MITLTPEDTSALDPREQMDAYVTTGGMPKPVERPVQCPTTGEEFLDLEAPGA